MQQLKSEVEELRSLVSGLTAQMALLQMELQRWRHPIEILLRQRGLSVLTAGESPRLLLPPGAARTQQERFYQYLRRYSFRLFLRDLIQFPEGNGIEGLKRYCSHRSVISYLRALSDLGIVELREGGGYRLIPRHIVSFGATLEWYVSEIFQRELLAPAMYNVRLGQTRFGGDYDVIAALSGYLVYVEVKSSPPRGIEQAAVSAFLNRLEDLQPHVAVFLVDTELRMQDKIVLLFEEALAGTAPSVHAPGPVVRLVDEIFHAGHRFYLLNSRRGIYSNLRLCFRDFFHNSSGRGQKGTL